MNRADIHEGRWYLVRCSDGITRKCTCDGVTDRDESGAPVLWAIEDERSGCREASSDQFLEALDIPLGRSDDEAQRREGYSADQYTEAGCTNCDRHRVLLCKNGKLICEKCSWDQAASAYCGEFREFFG